MDNIGYSCPSFINYNLSVYSSTNLFDRDTNHGNDNISHQRALLASQTLTSFADAQVDEIFKTHVYKAHYGKHLPSFYKKKKQKEENNNNGIRTRVRRRRRRRRRTSRRRRPRLAQNSLFKENPARRRHCYMQASTRVRNC